jgi:hypothetical protein
MMTSSVEAAQGALLMVQRSVAEPTANPVIPEVGLEGAVMLAVPETTDQLPVPLVGVLAERVAVLLQILWSLPAAEVVGVATCVMMTSSNEFVQGALLTVQRSVAEPTTNPVTPEVGLEGVVMLAVPETTDQLPVPLEGVLAANVAVLAQTF